MKIALLSHEDPQVRESVGAAVADMGMGLVQSPGAQVRKELHERPWDIILLGWELEGGVPALDALAEAKRILPDTPVLIISPFPDLAYARRAIALGAFDYIEIPFTRERLQEAVTAALPGVETADPMVKSIRRTFVGVSRSASGVVQNIKKFAEDSKCDVLITGETGTGKEVAARAIHKHSQRRAAPWVAENCANFSSLDVSELFGHDKGAYTGADAEHLGAFERTGEGTLLLDEVQDLSPDTQARLLRVVEKRRFRRLRGEKELTFRGRILYATNQDLSVAVRQGVFREDLFHRISAHRLHIPPLRERKDDITALAQHFLKKLARDRKIGLSRSVIVLLNDYDFPGNVRELRNVIAHAVSECQGPELLARHILPRLDTEIDQLEQDSHEMDRDDLYTQPLKEAALQLERDYCRKYLPWILASCNNNLTQAALKAGIDPKTFRRKWKECGLERLSTR